MIDRTKKRLILVFTIVVVAANVLLGSFSLILLHMSLTDGLKKHIKEDIREEFAPYFRAGDFGVINSLREDEVYQVLKGNGEIAAASYSSKRVYPALNHKLLDGAFAGTIGFETQSVRDSRYLVSYFPLDKDYSGRVIMSLKEVERYEAGYVKMMIAALPVILMFSYLVSRYLVNRAMIPIDEVLTFQETFSSNVLHELRSPLASLKGNMEVSLRKERTPGEYKEVITSNLGEVDRINNLLNNLYLLASSKFKPLELFKNGADIKPIAEDLMSSYSGVIASKKLRLDVSGIESGVCQCDIGLIRRAIENLFDNAVKYTPEGGLIKLGVSKTHREVIVTIENTYKGLGKDELKHIFDPFYRGRNSVGGGAEGMGLGLYIASYIVRSHGGDIRIDSNGDMLSFTISLPLK